MLQRIRTLAVQAANGTNTAKDRKALQEEVDSLSYEITRIAQKTTFAGALVLDGGGANTLMRQKAAAAGGQPAKYEYFFQVGANAKDEITLECGGFKMNQIASQLNFMQWKDANGQNIPNDKMSKSGLWCSAGGGAGGKAYSALRWQVSSPEDAQNTLANIDKFIEFVDSKRAGLGAIQNRMESTIRNQSSISENESDARSRIRDTDFASETAALTSNQIIQQASQTILSQANQRPTIALQLLGQ